MSILSNVLAVGVGAAFGAIARWLLGIWLNQAASTLPWGTLAANLVGAYLIGLALGCFLLFPETPGWLKLLVTTGFLGGLTTFSTYSAETVGLIERGQVLSAIAYSGLSLLGALLFTGLGLWTVSAVR
ncbi:fluoride efflux transporter CrcB [Pusillimonas sp.]|uniref:fluoride efflux transporter CrcB n=1 Tax=Pusillimonas sp. TaxID=3040095 RepID=UPI0037C59CC6